MRVLIFTASAGNGHNSAARTITNKLKKENPNIEIKTVDAYKAFANKLQSWKMETGYFLACKYLLEIYNACFKASEKNGPKTRFKNNIHNEVQCFIDGLLKEIYTYQPDIIISTYIFVAVAICDLKRVYKIPAKTIALTLDYGISPYWECTTGVDKMFITGEYMRKPFIELGFRDEQLVSSGIAIDEKFYTKTEQKHARQELELDENKFTVVVMKGGFFTVSAEKLVTEFEKVKSEIQVVFINGKDKDGYKRLNQILKRKSLKQKYFNVGFTDKIEKYYDSANIIVGKAGGLSTTEAINKEVPSIIVSKLPQQEKYNRDYLVETGCALAINSKHPLNKLVQKCINDKTLIATMKENCAKIKNNKTMDIYYDVISKMPLANYDEIHQFIDSRNRIISKVKANLKDLEKIRKLREKFAKEKSDK